jgi:hypothetical protein
LTPVDQKEAKDLAFEIEKMIDSEGWDQADTAFFFRNEDGKPVIDTVVALMVDGKGYTNLDAVVELLPVKPDGVAYVAEGWAYPERILEMMRSGKTTVDEVMKLYGPPAAQPDRDEIRMVTVVSKDSPPMQVLRIRGKEPEFHGDNVSMQGPLLAALERALFGGES